MYIYVYVYIYYQLLCLEISYENQMMWANFLKGYCDIIQASGCHLTFTPDPWNVSKKKKFK